MGFLDRLAGVKDTFTEIDGYFHADQTIRVVWTEKRLSPYAVKIAPAYFDSLRQFMFDRMYLVTMFEGTMIRLLKANQAAQEEHLKWLFWMSKELSENGRSASPLKESALRGRIVESSSAPLEDHIRTVLYQGRGGNLMNRDYTVKQTAGVGSVAGYYFMVALGRSLTDSEAQFYGDWLAGTFEYYRRHTPNGMASEVPATQFGMSYAVDQATNRFASRLGINPPTF